MRLSERQIKTFQTLYQRRFGKQITKEEAHEQGIQLVRLVQLIGTAEEQAVSPKENRDTFSRRKIEK